MALTILKRPYARAWSGNPLFYQLYSAEAAADATVYFEIAVWFKRHDEAAATERIILPFYPVNGIAKIDIHDIVDGLLEYELPNLSIGFTYESQLWSNKMTGFVYIKYRQVEDGVPTEWANDAANEVFVIKGGISYEKWRGDNFWTNYFDTVKPWLSWQQSGRLAGYNERMYLAWLNLTDVSVYDIRVRRKLVMTDGTEYLEFFDAAVPKYHVLYFPCGAAQLDLENVDDEKTVWYWELQVFDTNDPSVLVPLSVAFKYELDNRNDYNAICLNYRNSLGGLDSVCVRGLVDYTQERNFTEQDRIVFTDYFIEHFIEPKKVVVNSTELLIYKGDIGHLGKEEQDRLRDIHHRRECWWEKDDKWLPVVIITGSQRLRTSRDKLFVKPIEFTVASGGNNYYTPESVDLAEANEETAVVCDVVISDPTYSEPSPGTYLIDWDLVSGTPLKYYVSTPGYSGGSPGETTDTQFTFPWLPVGTNVITVQPLCEIGGEIFRGVAKTVEIEVADSCTAVGWDGGEPNPPDATVDVPYSYSFDLTGTAPFVLLPGGVKPDWMMVSIDGSTVTLSGTPPPGSETGLDDAEVTLAFGNCFYSYDISFTAGIKVFA